MRKIGIAIPTYNRYQFTIDCFAQVINDERVESVTIVDDCSTDDSYEKLQEYFKDEPKVRLFRNEINKDCYANKHEAVEKSNSEFVCLWDSDNVFDKDYLDALYSIQEWDKHICYLPEWAKPHFSAKKWSGLFVTKKNVSQYIDSHLMTNLNAMNFFINREEYLKVWDGSVDAGSSDSIYFSLCWIKAGNSILITPNMQYYHRIHEDKSNHYNQNCHKYVGFHNQVMNEIKQLS